MGDSLPKLRCYVQWYRFLQSSDLGTNMLLLPLHSLRRTIMKFTCMGCLAGGDPHTICAKYSEIMFVSLYIYTCANMFDTVFPFVTFI